MSSITFKMACWKQCGEWSGEGQECMWEAKLVFLLRDSSDLGNGSGDREKERNLRGIRR